MAKLTTLPKAMLFDLDGTLADTIAQLAKAANASIEALGLKPRDEKVVQAYVGNGVNMLLCRNIAGRFEVTLEDIPKDYLKKAREVFNEKYSAGLDSDYTVYPGVRDGLVYFKSRGIKIAVVTNKPQMFAVPLLKYMGLYDLFDFVLGGEVLKERKPDPKPVLYCLEKLGVKPSEAVMVGDSDNDVLAGINAKTCNVFFTYGYNRNNLDTLKIDYRFDSFDELTQLIKTLN